MSKRQLETLSFDNSYARLPEAFYAKLNPTPFSSPPYLLHANNSAAELIDLVPDPFLRLVFVGVFCGSMLVQGIEPLPMLYSGHQYAVDVPHRVDGLPILLGDVLI